MNPMLLHAVARKAEAITPDAELLARYLAEHDQSAFEELVRRHGPLVWAVCRHMLPCHADAEDAFQAVFLALVRSAARIRDGRAFPAWLHGVAVRVATRARREVARRRRREQATAAPEADRPVSDAAWELLAAAVHEEVQKLPEAERTVFVLCDLQGVSQADAAARLGWPLGSVSGRLCKARQRLLDRLAARGVAPAAVVGIGITSGAASAVPSNLFEVVKTFPGVPGAASTAATALARGFVEGVTMRVKLTAAVAVVAAAFGMTGGAVLLSKAEAQPPGAGLPPGGVGGVTGGGAGLTPGADPFGQPPDKGKGKPKPGATGGPGGMPGMGSGYGSFATVPTTWEYKFVDVRDRSTFESTITRRGKDGWEFCSSERFGQGIVLVFKKKQGGSAFGGGMMSMPGMAGAMGDPSGLWGAWGGRDGIEVRSVDLKNASATDVAAALRKALPKGVKAAVPGPGTNRLLVVADVSALKDINKLIEELEARAAKPGGREAPGPNANPLPGGRGLPTPGMGPMGAPLMPGTGGPMGFGKKPDEKFTIVNLKNAQAAEMEVLMKKLFPTAEMVADARTNALIIRTDRDTLVKIEELIAKLDEVPSTRK